MNSSEKIFSANLIAGQREVGHQNIHVHTIELNEDPEYKVVGDEVKYQAVDIKLASSEKIKEALKHIGLIIDDESTIMKVSIKFWKQITSIEGGYLAFHQNTKTFYEIIRM